MKKKGLLLILVALVCLLFALPNNKEANAADETTVTMTTFSAASANMDSVVSYSTAKGGGTSNPLVNSSGDGIIRLYQNSAGTGGGTITVNVAEGATLQSVTIGSSMATSVAYTLGTSTTKSNNSSLAANGKLTVDSINESSITFYCMGKDKNSRLYVNYLSVTYVLGDSEGGSTEPEEPTYADSSAVQALVSPYYNEGTYTKKSYININQEAIEEVATFNVSSLFVGGARLDRTTYYWPTELLMTTIDNDYAEYNSGYGTDANGNLTQFKRTSLDGENINEHYSANKNHENWNDTTLDGMEGFYVTLNDMMADGYFAATEDSGWTLSGTTATYNITTNDDEFVKDFLAFVAPCFEPVILNAEYSNYFDLAKLEITTGSSNRVGDYLRLRIYVSDLCEGYVLSEKVLAEACVYQGTVEFDENNLTIADLRELGVAVGDYVNIPVTFVRWTNNGSNQYHFQDLDGIEFVSTSKPSEVTLNDELVLNAKITKISESNFEVNNATLVEGTLVEIADPDPIISTIAEVNSGAISISQAVIIEGVVISVDEAWNSEYNNMVVTISDIEGNTIKIFRVGNETNTPAVVGNIIKVTGKVDIYSNVIQIGQGGTYVMADVTNEERLQYEQVAQAALDKAEVEALEVTTSGTETFTVPMTGTNGSAITWTVSPTGAVLIDDQGNVTFERGEENVAVTLTATIGESSKDFTFTIVKKPSEGGSTQPTVTEYTETIKYSDSTTTTNMDGSNQASILGVNVNYISVVGVKNKPNNNIGLNKAGEFRLYANKADGDGNELVISGVTDNVTIKSITITFGSTVGSFTVNGVAGSKSQTVYEINSNSVTIKNTQTSTTTQVHIKSIVVTYEVAE